MIIALMKINNNIIHVHEYIYSKQKLKCDNANLRIISIFNKFSNSIFSKMKLYMKKYYSF